MYNDPYYHIKDIKKLIAFAKENPLAFITGCGETYPVATQLPLVIHHEENKILFRGHLMRNTDHHLSFQKNNNVLVLFYSPYAFIDANWYEKPAGGSTVNYMSVHAKGQINFTDEAGTYEAVKNITDKYIGKGTPASFENISEEYKAAMVKAISGFEIEVQQIEGVFKLSQNMSASERQNIIANLEKRNYHGDQFIASKMKEALT